MNGVNEFFDYCGMGFKTEDTTLCFLPLAHIFDRGSCQGAAIFNGCTIAYARVLFGNNGHALTGTTNHERIQWGDLFFHINFKHSFSASASMSPELLKFFYFIGIIQPGEKSNLYFYRDSKGNEVDLVCVSGTDQAPRPAGGRNRAGPGRAPPRWNVLKNNKKRFFPPCHQKRVVES
jgi:hypothetical protein